MISERAKMSIGQMIGEDRFNLSLRFRTEQTPAHIVSVLSPENVSKTFVISLIPTVFRRTSSKPFMRTAISW